MYLAITPREWGLKIPDDKGMNSVKKVLGISYQEIQKRCKNAVYEFLDRLYDEKENALHHFYRADVKHFGEFDSGNFLMAINYIIMYDCYQDIKMIEKAENCFEWAYSKCTEIQPMFTWQGGVRDGFKSNELYLKYTGDAMWTCLALYERLKKEEYLFYAKQFHNFMKQARKAGFKYKYNTDLYQWSDTGFCWRAFGYPIIAYLEYYNVTGEEKYLEYAIAWGEHGLTLQERNGAFYLIDGEFWNSDLTATEIRGLVSLYKVTGMKKFLRSAILYADWVIKYQREDGAWPVGIDTDNEICAPNVGPGDVSNILISLVYLHDVTKERRYLESAIKATKYSLAMQAVEDGRYPLFLDDRNVKWGFWSWEPLYDYTLSGDQSVHHIRALMLIADYLGNLDSGRY